MKKTGYFFYSFLPILAAEAAQLAASLFVLGLAAAVIFLVKGVTYADFYTEIQTLFSSSDFTMALSLVYALITIAVCVLWYYCKFEGEVRISEFKHFNLLILLGIILLIPACQFISSYICLGIEYAFPSIWDQYESLMESAGLTDNSSALVIAYTVIAAPICEELIFRGVTLRSMLRGFPFWFANIFQAILFGIFHLNFVQGTYAAALGLVLGYVCYKTGSIYCSMLFHILFNGWAMFVSVPLDKLFKGFSEITTDLILLPFAIVFFTLGFILLVKGIKRKKNKACIL